MLGQRGHMLQILVGHGRHVVGKSCYTGMVDAEMINWAVAPEQIIIKVSRGIGHIKAPTIGRMS